MSEEGRKDYLYTAILIPSALPAADMVAGIGAADAAARESIAYGGQQLSSRL